VLNARKVRVHNKVMNRSTILIHQNKQTDNEANTKNPLMPKGVTLLCWQLQFFTLSLNLNTYFLISHPVIFPIQKKRPVQREIFQVSFGLTKFNICNLVPT
jgi:hypothetical protein